MKKIKFKEMFIENRIKKKQINENTRNRKGKEDKILKSKWYKKVLSFKLG